MAEPPKFTYIRDIGPGMRNVNAQFIVLDISLPRKTKDGHDIRTVRVADKSASINLAVWDEIGACLQPGDICRLLNGYVTLHKLSLTLNCGRLGEVQKVSEFCMIYSETPFMSAVNPEYAKPSESVFQKHPPSSTGGGNSGGNGTGNGGGGGGSENPSSKDAGGNGNGNGSVPPPDDASIQQQSASYALTDGTDDSAAVASKTGRTAGKWYRKENRSTKSHVTKYNDHVTEPYQRNRYYDNRGRQEHGERRESRIGVV